MEKNTYYKNNPPKSIWETFGDVCEVIGEAMIVISLCGLLVWALQVIYGN